MRTLAFTNPTTIPTLGATTIGDNLERSGCEQPVENPAPLWRTQIARRARALEIRSFTFRAAAGLPFGRNHIVTALAVRVISLHSVVHRITRMLGTNFSS